MAWAPPKRDNPAMKFAFALVVTVLPAMLAAKVSYPTSWQKKQEACATYSLITGWQASPILADQVL